MNGFIKLHRQFILWEWYHNNNTKVVFLHLLLTANFKDKRWQGITIKRGQLVISKAKLGQKLGLSIQQIKTAFSNLRTTGEITNKATNKYTIVTICKYDTYQSFENPNNQQNNQRTTNNPTNEQPQLKKDKNKERINKSKESEFFNNLPTETNPADKRKNKALPFDVVTASETLAAADPEQIKQAVKNIYQIEITDDQINRAAFSFSTVAVAQYDKYKGIRQHEKLINLFIDWIPKNIKYNNQPKPNRAGGQTVDDLKEYFTNNYSKRWNLVNVDRKKNDLKLFSDWLPRLIELKKELKNDTLNEIILFYIIFRHLGETINGTPNPERRLKSFKNWFHKLSDYNQRKGDIKKILLKKADNERI